MAGFLSEEAVIEFAQEYRKRCDPDSLVEVCSNSKLIGSDILIIGGHVFVLERYTRRIRTCLLDRIVSIGYYDPDCPEASETPF